MVDLLNRRKIGNLVVSSSEHWDLMSRRWKKRRAVQEVKLFIADGLLSVPIFVVGCWGGEGLTMETRGSVRVTLAWMDSPSFLVTVVSLWDFVDTNKKIVHVCLCTWRGMAWHGVAQSFT